MIKAILIFNNHGKPRLSKFYQPYVSARRRRSGRGGFRVGQKVGVKAESEGRI